MTPLQSVLRVAVWAALFTMAGYVGRATIIDDQALSLVWPAAGVAGLWLCTGNRRTWPWDLAALVTTTYLVNASTGAPPKLAIVFIVCNVVQVVTFYLLVRRLRPDVWGFGGDRSLSRLGDLSAIAFGAVAGCALAAGLGWAGTSWAIGAGGVETFLVWTGRNVAGLLVITTVGLLMLAPLRGRSASEILVTVRRAVSGPDLPHRVEVAGHVAVTAAVVYVVFFRGSHFPLMFVVLFTTVLAGVRLTPTGVGIHGVFAGGASIALTLNGYGPLAVVEDLNTRALLVQVYVVLTVITGLVLAFVLAERNELNRQLLASERATAERAALFRAVLDTMHEGVAVIRDDGHVLVRNPAGHSLMGLDVHDPVDRVGPSSSFGLFRTDGRRLTDAEMPHRRALLGDDVEREDYHVRGPDERVGRVLEFTATSLPRVAPEDRPRVIVSYRDVTADRAHRDSLAAFAGVVAHDLTNPLAVVRGWAETLAEDFAEGPVDGRDGLPVVAHIENAANQMSQFIDDLLAFTVARDNSLAPVDIDVSALAEEVKQDRGESDTRPRIVIEPGLRAHADPFLVRQLLDNLIGNAIKYVAPGVRPRVRVSGEQREGWLELSVSDNGIGVPSEHRGRIFENFQRAHTDGYRGTGIGLAICRQVVERHGGTIEVHDGPGGQGSRFALTLPAPAA